MTALFEQIASKYPAAAEPGPRVLLTEYCRIADGLDTLHAAINQALEAEGIGCRFIVLTSILDTKIARMVQIATALGLTQSRRFRADAAAAVVRRSPRRHIWKLDP